MTRLVNKDPKKVEAVIKADPEALALFREAMKSKPGPKPSSSGDNVTRTKTEKGNSRAYSITRVQKECDEETVKDVMAGKVSPNAETKKQT